MTATRGKVLVLGKEDRAFLAVVRSLGRRGLEVHLAWCPPDALARHSRYVTRVHEMPPYSPTDGAWKEAFVELFRRERFDLVVPTNDSTIIPLQTHRAELEPHARIYLLADDTFAVAFDKAKTYELARSLGIPVPVQERFPLPLEPAAVLARFRLPVVLKPRASFRLEEITAKRFVRKVATAADLDRHLRSFASDGEVWVQEHFEGAGVGVEGLVDHGETLVALQHVRIHERRKGGADSYRKTVPLHPELHDAFRRLMRALAYTGVGMLEFKLDLTTGAWTLLELNARFWASLPVAVAAGADFPWYLYQLLVEERREFPQAYRNGVYCRNWGRDLVWLRENALAPATERVPLGSLVRELGPLLALRERSDTFALDDPSPGLEDLRRLGRRGVAWLGRQAGGLVATTGPVRRLRGARARRALRQARRLLFVCKGNICRSPFAAGYARRALTRDTEVGSAGYYPKDGRPCPAEAIAAARELGIDLASHRSMLLDEGALRRADAVFVFDRHNYRAVTERYPFARPKLHLVGDLAANGRRELRDPYGGTLDDFRGAYRWIRDTLDAGGQGTVK